jgi:hypothetical protein
MPAQPPPPSAPPLRPAYRGLAAYRHLRHRFSLLYPEDWGRADAPAAAGGGVVFTPDPQDRHTSLLVQSRRLPGRVRPADLEALREGFQEGLQQLPDVVIARQHADAVGKLLDLEAEHTYRDPAGGETRRRWVRLLCQDRVQVSLVAQGSSEQAYAYWLPMFNTVMRTVRFADWWAESTGTSWQASLVGDQPSGPPESPGPPG